ncbi:MAG TPA: cyclic nucleotide-binding domain-containing protein [Anaerolineales bacterium]|nr:cyclic nucleotide-binding domain-containing protein [Anaerolineales bacterium]
MIELAQRIEFLRRIHLFYRLEDEHFESVARKAQEVVCQPGDIIVRQGAIGDRFYMIYSGTVTITRQKPHGGQTLAKLVPGDYFGEESLLTSHKRNATVTADGKTVLLTFSKDDFKQLLKTVHQLKANFEVAVDSHRLARSMEFKWLRDSDGEVIYFLARKHPILLFRMLLLPAFLATIALLGLIAGLLTQNPWLEGITGIGLALILLWAGWNAVDWGNDYYIVTNQRVVWLEKVVGIYDSRQEAPLSAIQRINVQTEFVGRQMDYGNLIVRTIVGSTLTLRNVNHPYQAAALVEEHWKRSKQSSRRMEETAMRDALRERLLRKQAAPAVVPSLVEKPQPRKKNPYSDQRGFANFFRVRFEGMSTITYRKHWVVLIEKTWLPGLILLALFGWLIFEIVTIKLPTIPTLIKNAGVDALLVVWLLLFVIIFTWWFYRYIDWSNDIYQVTPDQILDINKRPLGEVTSDIASLDNILHLEYERRGLGQILFNYGNVHITIGGGKDMIFEDVYSPSAVQDDIERRRLERIAKKEEAAVKAERERMADWFAAYHHSTEELRQAEEEEKNTPEEGEPGPGGLV